MKEFIRSNLMIQNKDENSSGNIFISRRLNKKWFIDNGFESEYKTILELFPDEDISFGGGLICILKDITKPNLCLECGKVTKYNNHKREYQKFCCVDCSYKNEQFKKYRTSCIDSSIEKKLERIKKIKITKANTPQYRIAESVKKAKETKLAKYGDANYNNSIKSLNTRCLGYINRISPENYLKLNDFEYLESEYSKGKSASSIAEDLGVAGSTVVVKMNELGVSMRTPGFIYKSSGETEVCEFLDSLGVAYETSNRKVIYPLELDIYIPEFKLGIEFDGIYWHSENNGKDKNYHLNKTMLCEERGIHLLHIFDNEWNDKNKQEIWKSIIRHKVGKSNTIYARNCKLVEDVDKIEVRKFLENNHIQGFANSKYNFGLVFNGNLVSLMTFSKNRYSEKAEFELVRFCNKIGTSVVGGFSRLLKAYNKKIGKSLISYANRRWSLGNVYNNIGFKLLNVSTPNYFYTSDYINLHSRQKFQKHKLKDILVEYDPSISEYENMKNSGFDRIWDCGNLVYLMAQENA